MGCHESLDASWVSGPDGFPDVVSCVSCSYTNALLQPHWVVVMETKTEELSLSFRGNLRGLLPGYIL